MSCIYKRQWSEIAQMAHFKEAESKFPNLGAEDLLHRAEEIAKESLAKSISADRQRRKEAEVLSAIDWED